MLKALSRWGTIARNMAKKYIPLAEWAKLHGLPIQSVRDSASRWGLKKYTKKVAVPQVRLFIEADAEPTDSLLLHKMKKTAQLSPRSKSRVASPSKK